MEKNKDSGFKAVKVALVALPLCLVVSIIGAVWFHWHSETTEKADPALALANEGMSRGEVEDLMEKFGWLNGEGWEIEAGRKGLKQRMALIGGTLSPQNYGYVVQKGVAVSHESELWPMVWVDVEGGERKNEVVVVSAPYDLGSGDVVALLTAAKELRDIGPARTIRVLFYPWWLYQQNEGRRNFLQVGEEVVAVLQVQQMEEATEGGAGRLQVRGPSLGARESALGDPEVERVIHEQVAEVERVFGPSVGAVFQQVAPSGAEGVCSKREYPGSDLDALMARTQVLVRLLGGLAGAE